MDTPSGLLAVVFLAVLASLSGEATSDCYVKTVPASNTLFLHRNDDVSIVCDASCFGRRNRGQVTWYGPGGNPVPRSRSGRMFQMIYNRNMFSRLFLFGIGEGDSGTYTCSVGEGDDVKMATIFLDVSDGYLGRGEWGVDSGRGRGDVSILVPTLPPLSPLRRRRAVPRVRRDEEGSGGDNFITAGTTTTSVTQTEKQQPPRGRGKVRPATNNKKGGKLPGKSNATPVTTDSTDSMTTTPVTFSDLPAITHADDTRTSRAPDDPSQYTEASTTNAVHGQTESSSQAPPHIEPRKTMTTMYTASSDLPAITHAGDTRTNRAPDDPSEYTEASTTIAVHGRAESSSQAPPHIEPRKTSPASSITTETEANTIAGESSPQHSAVSSRPTYQATPPVPGPDQTPRKDFGYQPEKDKECDCSTPVPTTPAPATTPAYDLQHYFGSQGVIYFVVTLAIALLLAYTLVLVLYHHHCSRRQQATGSSEDARQEKERKKAEKAEKKRREKELKEQKEKERREAKEREKEAKKREKEAKAKQKQDSESSSRVEMKDLADQDWAATEGAENKGGNHQDVTIDLDEAATKATPDATDAAAAAAEASGPVAKADTGEKDELAEAVMNLLATPGTTTAEVCEPPKEAGGEDGEKKDNKSGEASPGTVADIPPAPPLPGDSGGQGSEEGKDGGGKKDEQDKGSDEEDEEAPDE